VTEKNTSNNANVQKVIIEETAGLASISELSALSSSDRNDEKKKKKNLKAHIGGTEASPRDGFTSSAIPLPT